MNKNTELISGYDNRSDVPKEYTWALEDLYTSDDEWKKDLVKLKDMIPKIEALQGTLGNCANNLLKFFELQDEISILLDSFAN